MLFALSISFFAPLLEARADSLNIQGVAFQVDKLRQLDANTSELSLFGESRIVAQTDLERIVLCAYGTEASRLQSYTDNSLLDLYIALLNNSKSEISACLLDELLIRRNLQQDLFSRINTLSQKQGNAVITGACKEALQILSKGSTLPESAAECLSALMLVDLDWVRENLSAWVFRHSDLLLRQSAKLISAAILRRDIQSARSQLDALLVLFSDQKKEIETLQLAIARAEELIKLTQLDNAEGLFPPLSASFSDAETIGILEAFILDLTHSKAAQLLSAGAFAQSLRLLSLVPPGKRTPTTHELSIRALGQLAAKDYSLLLDRDVANWLEIVARNDSRLKDIYLATLDKAATQLVLSGKLDDSEAFLRRILNLRRDPDQKNDALRLIQARALLRDAQVDKYDAKLSEIGTGLPFFARFEFFCMRASASKSLQSCSLLLLTLVVAMTLLRVHHRRLAREKDEASVKQANKTTTAGSSQAETGRFGPGFSGVHLGLSPRRNEYDKCLSVLGLKGDASLKAIKASYRSMVKEVHPDLHDSADTLSKEKFIQLTSIYDRILELRRELEIDDA